jgi:predicted ABC-type sugar transport system permease subunit
MTTPPSMTDAPGDPASDGRDMDSVEAEPTADLALMGGSELVAGSLSEYLRAFGKRIRSGDSGALPVVIGLIIIVVIFQSQNSKFLSAGNLTNLLGQSGVFVLLGMAEVFVLLLGEIDLSIGYVAGGLLVVLDQEDQETLPAEQTGEGHHEGR